LTITCNKLTQDNPPQGTTTMQGVSNTAREKIPTATGAVIWQPNRGAGSLYTFGIVPAGANAFTTSVTNTNISLNVAIASTTTTQAYPANGLALITMNATSGNFVNLFYKFPVPVPYNGINPNDIIQISPNLSDSFSLVRLFSGDVRVICDTVPIGNTALNGYLSCGAFTDSRDVTQVVQSGGQTANCLDPSDLVQTSVTRKEGLKEINVMKGIITLVGSDIQPFYAPPQTDITDVVNAFWTTYNLTPIAPAFFGNGGNVPVNGQGLSYPVLAGFISPWNIQMSESGSGTLPVYNNINTSPINLNGCLDIQLIVGATNFQQNGVAVANYYWRLRVTFTHIFGNCTSGPTYAMSYLSQSEVTFVDFAPSEPFIGVPSNPLFANYPQYQGIIVTNPRMYPQNMTSAGTGGMYLGTQITCSWEFPQTTQGGTATLQNSPTLTFCTAQVRARSLYNPGEIGPTRVVRWDSMSDGQYLKIDGCINCQCIPEGVIAPFVQGQAMFADTAHNLNVMTMLSELYNGNTPVSRNYVLEEYLQHASGLFQEFGPEHILQWANPKLTGTASAAGMFMGARAHADGRFNAGGSQYLTGGDPTNPQGAFGRREASASGHFGGVARSTASRHSRASASSKRSRRRSRSGSSRGSSVM
jgi:hypothetical protein